MNTPTESSGREFLTPQKIGELLGVGHDKVLGFIRTGELRAIDLSTTRGKRPRWRISRDDLDAFLARRSATPPPKPRRQRRQPDDVIEYY